LAPLPVSARLARLRRAVALWRFSRVAICIGRSPRSTRRARRSVLASALLGEPLSKRRLRVVLNDELKRLRELPPVDTVR
jgi:hypothetical protein